MVMQAQKIFDNAVKFAMNQGIYSASALGCLYRSNDGLCCFVGAFIPDNLYRPLMENKNISDVLSTNPVLKDFMQIQFMSDIDAEIFWGDLQEIHDSTTGFTGSTLIESWITLFYNFGQRYDLNTDILEDYQ